MTLHVNNFLKSDWQDSKLDQERYEIKSSINAIAQEYAIPVVITFEAPIYILTWGNYFFMDKETYDLKKRIVELIYCHKDTDTYEKRKTKMRKFLSIWCSITNQLNQRKRDEFFISSTFAMLYLFHHYTDINWRKKEIVDGIFHLHLLNEKKTSDSDQAIEKYLDAGDPPLSRPPHHTSHCLFEMKRP
jgi:hypothetical protein